MNTNSESELLAALLALQPIVEEPAEYRVYYNQAGDITSCSMRDHPSTGDYLVVTPAEYDNYFRYNVVNGVLKLIDRPHSFSVQLKKSNTGYQVVKNHAGLLLEPDETYVDTEYYDTVN